MSPVVFSVLMRIWLCLLGLLAWMAVLLDNATTSFCLIVVCHPSFELAESNPITRYLIDLLGLDIALGLVSILALLVILWVYEQVVSSQTTRAIWMGSLTYLLLILIRGGAALNNWGIFTDVFSVVR